MGNKLGKQTSVLSSMRKEEEGGKGRHIALEEKSPIKPK